jgi:hypothetical protein
MQRASEYNRTRDSVPEQLLRILSDRRAALPQLHCLITFSAENNEQSGRATGMRHTVLRRSKPEQTLRFEIRLGFVSS